MSAGAQHKKKILSILQIDVDHSARINRMSAGVQTHQKILSILHIDVHLQFLSQQKPG
jgi:hypothetical protein